MKIYSGLISNLKDRWILFKKEIADSGWMAYVVAMLTRLGNKWNELAESKLQELAKNISDGFTSMAESIRISLSSITFDEVIQKTTEAFKTISTVLAGMQSAFEFTANSIKLVFNTFTISVKSFAVGILSVLGEISYGWQKIFGWPGWIT